MSTLAKDATTDSRWMIAYAFGALVALLVIVSIGLFRRGGLSKGRSVAEHPWYIWLCCGLLVWLGMGVAAGMLAGGSGLRNQALSMLGAYTAGIGIGAVLLRLLNASSPGSGLSLGWRAAGKGVVSFLLAWPIVSVAGMLAAYAHTLATGHAPDTVAHETLRSLLDNRSDPWAWVLAATAVIAAPIQEEIVYRGLLQSSLLALFKRPWAAVIASAAVFAAMHVGGGEKGMPWYAVATVFVLAVCMGAAFERTRSLAAPIVMHMLFNAANVALVFV
ncbi:MAG: CPBP family intramembrane metalloprotease [Planctomycetes bacterium]|nr:CPBP family intramembrane metalloprotease [Planctomycetota bacterium]